jgi:hypothetical protein
VKWLIEAGIVAGKEVPHERPGRAREHSEVVVRCVLRTDSSNGRTDWCRDPQDWDPKSAAETGLTTRDAIFDNEDKQVAMRIGKEAVRLDRKKKYAIAPGGELR